MNTPDLRRLDGVVSSRILAALAEASACLDALEIAHAVIGGLAVGAWGYPRATKDVDFLVRAADVFDVHGNIVTFRAHVPIEVNGVKVDYLPAEDHGLEKALVDPIVPVEALFLLKLRAWRRQDQTDLAKLIELGADVDHIRKWLRNRIEDEAVTRLDKLTAAVDAGEQ